MPRSVLALFVSLALLACSGSDTDGSGGGGSGAGSSSGPAGSCAGGKEIGCTTEVCCQDYAGNFTPATAQSSCSAIAGIYSADPCTDVSRVGSCTLYGGTAAEQTVRYYEGYTTAGHAPGAESAAANCTALHGSFE